MAKTKISEFSSTPANNTDIDSINIAEGCAPSGINDAIRELMAQLKDFQTGAQGDSFNGPVGTTTAAAGAFTTLTASGTLAVTGVATLTSQPIVSSLTASQAVFTDASKGLVSNAITGTGNVVMSASPTLTGTLTAASITASGTVTGNGNWVLGNADTDTITQTASYVTGTQLKSAKSATNTLNLAAYDVDGAAYTNLVTLTASNTPTLALTSTGVGTINNMSIGATTASTGAFTTLAASSDVTLSGGTANGVTYLNGSKVLTSGSALTFDGTNLSSTGGATFQGSPTGYSGGEVRLGPTTADVQSSVSTQATGSPILFFDHRGTSNTGLFAWRNGSGGASELMRLTSTGLGIGTSSITSGYKLEAQNGTAGTGIKVSNTGGGYATLEVSSNASSVATLNFTNSLSLMGGNVGIGTSPSYKLDAYGSGSQVVAVRAATSGDARFYAECAGTNSGWMQYTRSLEALQWSANGGTQHLTLNSSGNLGLGVTPSAWGSGQTAIQIGSTGIMYTPAVRYMSLGSNFYDDGSNGRYLTNGNATIYQQNRDNGIHAWYTAPSSTAGNAITFTQAMTLDASSNLLVGTTTASNTPSQGITLMQNTNVGSIGIGHANGTSSGNGYLNFAYNGSAIGSVTQSGTTAVLYNTTSDQRLKENIQDADSASSLIDSLQVRKFDWKADGSHQRYGFVAQELATVAPEAVHQPENAEEMMAVDYSKLVPMLVKEIQSLRVRVAQLEAN